MRYTRTRMRGGAVALALLLLAACGSADPGGPGTAGDDDDAGAPKKGGTLSVLQTVEPRTLDPGSMQNAVVQHSFVGGALFGQLLSVSPDGEVDFGLAEDLTTSDGGTTWQLTLRDGLTFSDDTPLDAAAVQFNWERLRDPAVGAASASYMAFVKSMTPQGQVLDFTLTTPIALFAEVIADRSLNWIASPKALQGGPQAFDAKPVGAGPYVLKSWQRQGKMVLVRNEKYYDPERPYIDELVLTVNADAAQRFDALTTGQVDAITSSNPDLVKIALEGGAKESHQEQGGGISIDMNTKRAPFDDVRARQAVALAVDLDAVNQTAYAGAAEVPDTLFVEDAANGDARLPTHDPEAAQKLFDELAAAGKPLTFTFSTYATTQTRRVAEAVQAQLNQFDDVKVDLEVLDNAAGVAKYVGGKYQMMPGQVSATALTMYSQFHSGQSGNYTGISDPELDAALEAAVAAKDAEALKEAFAEVHERFAELVPALPYIRRQWAVVHGDKLHGVELFATGAVRVDKLWVSE